MIEIDKVGLDLPLVLIGRLGLQLRLPRHAGQVRCPIEYNYRTKAEIEQTGPPIGEWEQPFDLHGLSVFLRDSDRAFHTYSAYARGADNLGFISNFRDLTPLGRQEEWEEPKGRATALGASAGSAGIRYHDEYDA